MRLLQFKALMYPVNTTQIAYESDHEINGQDFKSTEVGSPAANICRKIMDATFVNRVGPSKRKNYNYREKKEEERIAERVACSFHRLLNL